MEDKSTYGMVLLNMNHMSNRIVHYERTHMSAYEIILCNMNYMLGYETTLHIMKGYVKIWNHIAQYERQMKQYCTYVDVWFIHRHTLM